MKSNLEIYHYDSYGKNTLGVFFYDDLINFGWEDDLGIRSYKFKLDFFLPGAKNFRNFDRWDLVPKEHLEFIFTCDLKDWTITLPLKNFKKDEIAAGFHVRLNYFAICEKAVPKELKEIHARLLRRKAKKIPRPIKSNDHFGGKEFLEFTKDTACFWGGPFTQNDGKQGCGATIKVETPAPYPVINFMCGYSFYDLPDKIQGTVSQDAFEKFSKRKKLEFFQSLPKNTQLEIANKYFKGEVCEMPFNLARTLSNRVWLFGNDDTSYSKWFATGKEANEELRYLRMMQPLNFKLDITDRGYLFTN